MKRRPYQGAADVDLLQAFTSAARAETGGCGYLHPGDIPHHLFSGSKLYDKSKVMTIWEDGGGIAGWVLVSPSHKGFDAQIRPDLRGGDFERELLLYAEEQTWAMMRHYGVEGEQITADAFRCDRWRAEILTELGWEPGGDPPWVLNRASLATIPAPQLPDGFHARSVRGVAEAAAVAAVHVGSFGSKWTPEMYRQLMESPGYAAEREYVVVAPDGEFAAFTVTWHDPVNRVGLFEPVGTHRDYWRRGLGRALLYYAMGRMKQAGMESAEVVNSGTNEASAGLYRACGFRPFFLIDDFVKGKKAPSS